MNKSQTRNPEKKKDEHEMPKTKKEKPEQHVVSSSKSKVACCSRQRREFKRPGKSRKTVENINARGPNSTAIRLELNANICERPERDAG